MEFHEIANMFPLMEGAELTNLVNDIKQNGLLQPIVLYQEKILDGRNRYMACAKAGCEASFTHYEGKDPIGWVVSQNLHRRHLTESQRASVAAKIETLKHGGDRKSDQDANLHVDISREQAAEMLNVSKRSVANAAKVQAKGTPDLVKAVDSGNVKVSVAADIAELPQQEQAVVVALGEDEILKKAKEIRRERRKKKQKQNLEKKIPVPAPEGKYNVVIAAPPWPTEKIERDERPNQTAPVDYPTMTLQEIEALEIPAADDCHLWLWTTHKFLPDALRILKSWGFKYVNLFTWFKSGGFQPFGLPQYNTEFAVYGRKGAPKFVDTKNFFVGFKGELGAHSEKPTEFYDTIQRVTDGRRIEMFGRRPVSGFDSWVNDAEEPLKEVES